MGYTGQSGAAGDIKGRGELRCGPTTFVVAQPESDHVSRAIPCVARSKPSQDPCIQSVTDPVCRDDDGDADTGLCGNGPRLVQDDLQSRCDASEEWRI